jgi:hypothetical protein
VFLKKKTPQKPGEKKGAENYLPYTYVTSYKVISGDATSGLIFTQSLLNPPLGRFCV